MKDIGKYDELKKKYGSLLEKLEKVGDEISCDNKTLSKKLLLELINKNTFYKNKNALDIIDIIFYSRLHYCYK